MPVTNYFDFLGVSSLWTFSLSSLSVPLTCLSQSCCPAVVPDFGKRRVELPANFDVLEEILAPVGTTVVGAVVNTLAVVGHLENSCALVEAANRKAREVHNSVVVLGVGRWVTEVYGS